MHETLLTSVINTRTTFSSNRQFEGEYTRENRQVPNALYCLRRENMQLFLYPFLARARWNLERVKYVRIFACTRMNNSRSILHIRFEHKYFILHTFLTTRPYTYIYSIVILALYNDHSKSTRHACACMIIDTETYTKFKVVLANKRIKRFIWTKN